MSQLMIDTALFRPEAIAPETQKINDQVEQMLADLPTIIEIGPAAVRERRAAGQGLLAQEPLHEKVYWEEVSAAGISVKVRIFEPNVETKGSYLHIHGGGHTIGSAAAMDQTMFDWASAMHLNVVSVEYRLAPEHPWPAPADDCEAAALWFVENAEKRFRAGPLFIGGESAGAHLSAVTLLRLKHKHQLTPFAAANLVYGIFDMTGTPSMKAWGDRNMVISTDIVEFFGECLLPSDRFSIDQRRDPDISPLYADVSGLCPALFSVGTMDPLTDDTLLMATRWGAAKNPTELAIYPGGIHAFNQIKGLPLADEANERISAFLSQFL